MRLLAILMVLLLGENIFGQGLPGPMKLGSPLPKFRMISVPDGVSRSMDDYSNHLLLVFLFLSTHCAMSAARNEVFNSLAAEFQPKRVLLLGVYSGSKETLPGVGRYCLDQKLIFPCLKDVNNQFADQLGARVTPEVFVFDDSRHLRYRGSVDPLDDPKGKRDSNLRQALEALLQSVPVPSPETRSFGCIIDRQSSNRLKVKH